MQKSFHVRLVAILGIVLKVQSTSLPQPTQFAAPEFDVLQPRAPAPTKGPSLRQFGAVDYRALFGRQQDITTNTCGYIDRDSASPIVCYDSATQLSCAAISGPQTQDPVNWRCCTSTGNVWSTGFGKCYYATSCRTYDGTNTGDGYILQSGVLTCRSEYPACRTIILNQGNIVYNNVECVRESIAGTVIAYGEGFLLQTGVTTETETNSVTETSEFTETVTESPSTSSTPSTDSTSTPTSSSSTSTPESSTSMTTTSETSTNTPSPTSSSSPTPSATSSSESSSSDTNVGAIAGGTVGGVAAVALVAAAVIYLVRRKHNARAPPMREIGF